MACRRNAAVRPIANKATITTCTGMGETMQHPTDANRSRYSYAVSHPVRSGDHVRGALVRPGRVTTSQKYRHHGNPSFSGFCEGSVRVWGSDPDLTRFTETQTENSVFVKFKSPDQRPRVLKSSIVPEIESKSKVFVFRARYICSPYTEMAPHIQK